MKLTRAQVEALKLLGTEDRQTTRHTHHGYVGGRTMAGLVQRGLAFALPMSGAGESFYRISGEGHAALSDQVMLELAQRVERDLFAIH